MLNGSQRRILIVPESVGGLKTEVSPMKSVIDYSWHLRSQSRQVSVSGRSDSMSGRLSSHNAGLTASASLLAMKSSVMKVSTCRPLIVSHLLCLITNSDNFLCRLFPARSSLIF